MTAYRPLEKLAGPKGTGGASEPDTGSLVPEQSRSLDSTEDAWAPAFCSPDQASKLLKCGLARPDSPSSASSEATYVRQETFADHPSPRGWKSRDKGIVNLEAGEST